MSNSIKNLIVLSGPTAVGKSDLCLKLATHYQCPILSADSRQIYKELSLGTAKPNKEILKQTPHYFINHKSITENYSVGQYECEVIDLLKTLFETHETVLLSGGTGFYIDAVLYGLDQFPDVDAEITSALEKEFHKNALDNLLIQLKKVDPNYFEKVDQKNSRRVLRALGVSLSSGKPYSTFLKGSKKKRSFNFTKFVLSREREDLYHRINTRVDSMISAGLQEEVELLKDHLHRKSMQTVGYQEWKPFFDQQCTKQDVIELIKRNTRRYAKRQLTWFRRTNDWNILDAKNTSQNKLEAIDLALTQ